MKRFTLLTAMACALVFSNAEASSDLAIDVQCGPAKPSMTEGYDLALSKRPDGNYSAMVSKPGPVGHPQLVGAFVVKYHDSVDVPYFSGKNFRLDLRKDLPADSQGRIYGHLHAEPTTNRVIDEDMLCDLNP